MSETEDRLEDFADRFWDLKIVVARLEQRIQDVEANMEKLKAELHKVGHPNKRLAK